MDESVIKHLEQPQQVGTLKLSEAIRIGAALRPQSHFCMFDKEGGSCVQGAAAEALGFPFTLDYREMEKIRPLLMAAFGVSGDVLSDMQMRNDVMGGMMWSRERIADWLESKGY